jgi:hypothetical protein
LIADHELGFQCLLRANFSGDVIREMRTDGPTNKVVPKHVALGDRVTCGQVNLWINHVIDTDGVMRSRYRRQQHRNRSMAVGVSDDFPDENPPRAARLKLPKGWCRASVREDASGMSTQWLITIGNQSHKVWLS